MVAACRRHATDGRFITAMAAVAGSVAEELIGCFDDPRIARASVNNGGDIALHLREGEHFDIGVVADPVGAVFSHRHPSGTPFCHPDRSEGSSPSRLLDGRFTIDSHSPVRGIATSGWRGRSFSLGIADAVTVLAATASQADAAATVIANAVDVVARGIVRRPANTVRDDSDLGGRLVTVGVPALTRREIDAALDRGERQARTEIAAGHVRAAVLQLQGVVRVCSALTTSTTPRLQCAAALASPACSAGSPPAARKPRLAPNAIPASGARASCLAPSPAPRERVGVRAATSHPDQEFLPC